MPDPSSLQPGWFPDPLGRYDHRYFNGSMWTSDVSTGGERFVDPHGTAPTALDYGARGPNNSAATAAVVMGSIGAAIAWAPVIVVFGAALAVLALIFGAIGLRRSNHTGVGRGSAIAGIIMGGIGLAATVVGVTLTVGVFREVLRYIEPGDHDVGVTACELDGRRADVDGIITNLDDETRSYTVFVEIDGRREAATVSQVAPGETESWSTVVTTRAPLSECEPDLVVNGPFPYGIEVDPVEQ